jgi:hypothetical protein
MEVKICWFNSCLVWTILNDFNGNSIDKNAPKYSFRCKSFCLKYAAIVQQKCGGNRTAFLYFCTLYCQLLALSKLVGEIDS